MAVYQRVLLKLSGEALKSGTDLFDFDKVRETAEIIREMHNLGTEIGVVIGAGNIWRGRQGPAANMDAVTADQMGMLGTVINCLCMRDAVQRAGGDAVVMSAFEMNRVCEVYNTQHALQHLKSGKIVFFAAGSGNPFFSTDTAVVLRAVEVGADAILLAKNIDGVYTADPKKDPTATLIREISYEKAQDMRLKVMDSAAFALCAENKVPVVRVFGLYDPEDIVKVLSGDDMGTILHPEQ